MSLTATLTLLACATAPLASPQQAAQALTRALSCAPAQVEMPGSAPVLIMRCGEAGHPLEPVENLFREVEVLEVARRDGLWVAWVRRASSSEQVVFSYVFDDGGKISARRCHPSVPAEGTPVAATEGRTRFVDWCASVAPPCRPPSAGAYGTYVRFEVEDGRLVRPRRSRSASTVSDLGEAPETCVFEVQRLPVPVDAEIELEPSSDVVQWRPGEGRIERGPVAPGDLLMVGRGPRQVRIQGLAVRLGGAAPRALRVAPSPAAARVWKALAAKVGAHPQGRLRWDDGRFVLGLGPIREVWRPLDDGTLESICRYVDPRARQAPASADLPTGSDCRTW